MKQEEGEEQGKVAIVTGSSSGIGYATSLLLARNRFHTYATMRNIEKSADIQEIANKERLPLQVIQLDVNDDASIRNSIKRVERENERIDVLVNNAGYGLVGAFEDLSVEEIKSQFETNFFGVIRLTQQVLPIMRKQKSGTIVNVSSGAGRIGFPGMSAYVSSKFALEGLSESMSYELEPFGIKVVIIEPGVIRTNFKKNSVMSEKSLDNSSISPYSSIIQKIDSSISSIIEHATPPEDVAKAILHAITSNNPELRYLVGNDMIMMAETKKSMSDEDFRKMMMQSIIG
ncbi:MAG TPA: SDR family oxidoreductase [Nitrososphaeraceae archaeon]|nr:SDR family oxidoreductase [Nitrososphaeraceae archaeon]